MTLDLFAGNRVSDIAAARPWYERLFGGEPAFMPHDKEAVWELDERVEAISARGIEPAERETYSNGVRKVIYRDADGNEIGFGGPPE